MPIKITDENSLAWSVDFEIDKAAEKAEKRIALMSKKISDIGKEAQKTLSKSITDVSVKPAAQALKEYSEAKKAAADAAKAESQANTAVLNEQKKKEAANAREKKQMREIVDEYKQLNFTLGDLGLKYKNLVLTGNGNTEVARQTLKEYNALRKVLVDVDTALGDYRRHVGNYKSAFSGLGMSMQQLLREMPSLAINANVFFLAISNNLPIFFDAITQAKNEIKAANAALREAATAAAAKAKADALAAGASEKAAAAAAKQAEAQALANSQSQKAPSIWKMLGASLFSFQTLLTVGVTLLTLYGGKLIEWVGSLSKGNEALKRAKEEQEALVKAQESANKTAGQQIGKLTILNNVLTSNTASAKAKKGAYDQLIKLYPSYEAQLKDEYERTGNVANVIKNQLIPAIVKAAEARAYMSRIEDLSSQYLDRQLKSEKELQAAAKERAKLNKLAKDPNEQGSFTSGNSLTLGTSGPMTPLQIQQQKDNEAVKAYTKTLAEMKSIDNQINDLTNKMTKIDTGNLTIDGTDAGTYAKPDKKNRAEAEAKRLAENQKRIREEIAEAEAALTTRLEAEGSKQLAAINTKYNKMVADAREYKLSLLEIIKIEKLRSQEIDALKYEQETKKIVDNLNQQKDAYKSYEDFKLKAGKEAADKLYKDQIDTSKTFIQTVQDQARGLLIKATSGQALSSGEAARLKALMEMLKEMKKGDLQNAEQDIIIQKEVYGEMLRAINDFTVKRTEVERKYQVYFKALEKEKTKISADEYKKKLTKLTNAQNEELKAVEVYENEKMQLMQKDLSAASTEQIQEVIDQMEELLRTRKLIGENGQEFEIPPAALERIRQYLQQLYNLIGVVPRAVEHFDKLKNVLGVFNAVSSGIRQLSSDIGDANEGLKDTLETMADIVEAAGGLAGAAGIVAGVSSGKMTTQQAGSAASSIGGWVGAGAAIGSAFSPLGTVIGAAVGAIIGGVTAIIKGGKKVKESLQKMYEEFYRFQVTLELGEYRINEAMRERLLLQAQITGETLKQIKAQKETLTLNQKSVKSDEEDLLKKLQGESYISGQHQEKYGGFLGLWKKSRAVNDYTSLAGKTYEQIEALYMKGLLDGRAKELFEQLQKVKKEGIDIDKQLADLEVVTKELLTGTTANSIADSIVNGFKNGKKSIADFANDLETMIREAMSNALRYDEEFEARTKQWYDKFAQYAADGIVDASEKAILNSDYEKLISDQLKKKDLLEQATGVSVSDAADKSRQASQKGFAAMSQDSANELNGRFTTIQTHTYDMRESLKLMSPLVLSVSEMRISTANIQNNFITALKHLSGIERNTGRLEAIDNNIRQMKISIDDINLKGIKLKT